MSDNFLETEQWLSLSQAAKRLNVHPTTLRRWADNGAIPVMLTPGAHRRFSSSDMQQFANERRQMHQTQGIEEIWAFLCPKKRSAPDCTSRPLFWSRYCRRWCGAGI